MEQLVDFFYPTQYNKIDQYSCVIMRFYWEYVVFRKLIYVKTVEI